MELREQTHNTTSNGLEMITGTQQVKANFFPLNIRISHLMICLFIQNPLGFSEGLTGHV
jgi:hypothetical protein